MQVNHTNSSANALEIGLQGFQDAQSRVNQAAHEIASQEVTNSSENSIDQKGLVNSLVDLKVAEFDAKANVKVIQTANDLVGSLLDIRA